MKCGNCGAPLEVRYYPENPEEGQRVAVTVVEWRCEVCGFSGANKAGHFARRLERVERAAVAIRQGLEARVLGENEIAAADFLIVADAARLIDQLNLWAQGQEPTDAR